VSPDTAVALDTPILRIKGMTKIFPGTVALDDVDLEVRQGEVHALIGTNGSGKSTLIKVLAGYHSAEAGEAWVGGEPFQVTGRVDQSEALRFVHQDLGLVLQLNSLDNLALHGGYPKKSPNRIDWDKQRRMAFELLSTFDIGLNIDLPLSMATPVQRTVVAIAAALQGWNTERGMLVLDEPTAVLPPDEVGRLFEIIRGLKERGISVL
jgi:ABC-type sugar transport system ATPase subunit